MNWLALLDPYGRLERRPFAIAVVCVLLVSTASLRLLVEPVFAQAKLSPFAFAQAVLLWAWFSLHVNRLRDAGCGVVTAVGLSIIGGLMMGFYVIAAIEFVAPVPPSSETQNLLASDFVHLVRAILEEIFDFNEEDSARTALEIGKDVWWMRPLLAAILTLGFSIWVGSQRSAATQS